LTRLFSAFWLKKAPSSNVATVVVMAESVPLEEPSPYGRAQSAGTLK